MEETLFRISLIAVAVDRYNTISFIIELSAQLVYVMPLQTRVNVYVWQTEHYSTFQNC